MKKTIFLFPLIFILFSCGIGLIGDTEMRSTIIITQAQNRSMTPPTSITYLKLSIEGEGVTFAPLTVELGQSISAVVKAGSDRTVILEALNAQNESICWGTATMDLEAGAVKEVSIIMDWSFSLLFNGNGADSGSMTDIYIGLNETINLPDNSYTRIGYIFSGWNTDSSGSGTFYADGAEYTRTLPSQQTMYAQWELTDNEAVAIDKEALDVGDFTLTSGDSADSITGNFTLPSTGTNGTNITWSETADAENVIEISDFSVAVTRPSAGSGDATVEITATITKGVETETKVITLIVKEIFVPEIASAAAWLDGVSNTVNQQYMDCNHIERYGNYVYMIGEKTLGTWSLQAFNVSDPENIYAIEYKSLTSVSTTNGYLDKFDIEDDVLYVAGGTGTLYRYDIDPVDGTMTANHLIVTGSSGSFATIEVIDDSSYAYVGTSSATYKVNLSTGVATALASQVLKYWGVRIGSKIYGSGSSEIITEIDTSDDTITTGTQHVEDSYFTPSVYNDRWIFTAFNFGDSSVTDATTMIGTTLTDGNVYNNSAVDDSNGYYYMAYGSALYKYSLADLCDGDASDATYITYDIADAGYGDTYAELTRLTVSADGNYLFSGSGTHLMSIRVLE